MAKLTEEQRQQRALARARREALQIEKEDRRSAERRQQWVRDGMYLSYEEYERGVPCRGCGEPLQDGRGSWPALLKLTEQERAEHDTYETAFKERHRDCHTGQWSIEGSRTSHCFHCCPTPPMSKRKIQELSRIFASATPADPKNLDTWELSLTCDHLVERAQHKDHSYWSGRVTDCPSCGTRRGIVSSRRIGPANDPDGEAERERIEADIRKEAAKLERAKSAAAKAEDRIGELKSKLEDAGPYS